MLEHHLQRDIVYQLAFSDGLRFSEIQSEGVENKLFDYHLKKVLAAGYAVKGEDGLYRLSPEGRRVGVGAFRDHHMAFDRAYSILILAIRRKSDNAWLLYRRNTHPLRGLSGFMHTTPIAQQTVAERAANECYQKTGLQGTFTVAGNGYFTVFDGDELESFTHFTLLLCDDARGDLQASDERAEYYWAPHIDPSAPGMLPNMEELLNLCEDTTKTYTEAVFYR